MQVQLEQRLYDRFQEKRKNGIGLSGTKAKSITKDRHDLSIEFTSCTHGA